MEKLKTKSVFRILWTRIKEEKPVWFIFLFMMTVVFGVHYLTRESVVDGFDTIITVLGTHKNDIVALSISYIAGAIFYAFTVLLPYARNSKAVLPDVIAEVKDFLDDFRALSGELSGGDWVKDSSLLSRAENEISSKGSESSCGIQFSTFHKDMFEDYMSRFDKHISNIIAASNGYLVETELELLIQIKRHKTFELIRQYNDGENQRVFTKVDIHDILLGLIDINSRVIELYDKLCDRIYKEESKL